LKPPLDRRGLFHMFIHLSSGPYSTERKRQLAIATLPSRYLTSYFVLSIPYLKTSPQGLIPVGGFFLNILFTEKPSAISSDPSVHRSSTVQTSKLSKFCRKACVKHLTKVLSSLWTGITKQVDKDAISLANARMGSSTVKVA